MPQPRSQWRAALVDAVDYLQPHSFAASADGFARVLVVEAVPKNAVARGRRSQMHIVPCKKHLSILRPLTYRVVLLAVVVS